MRMIDADALPRHGRRGGLVFWGDIENAPTVDTVPKNMMFHIAIYNAMTEEHSLEEMTLEEILDKFTDEGYPYMEKDDE